MRTRPAPLLVLFGFALAAISAAASQSSLSVSSHGEITTCGDIHVSYDHHDAVRAEQQLTVPGTSLHARASQSGGIYLQSWDQPEFGITVCKAAKDATVLAAVNVGVNGNELSASGPQGEDWLTYYLIHAPRGASVEMTAPNGGVRLYHASGNFDIATQNGPIDIDQCSGTIDAAAQNGPVRIKGDQGKFTVVAQNGPVSVTLSGSRWQGELQASTHNGPLRLTLPNDFQSAVLVETAGHAPARCRVPACDKAQRTFDEERRVFRLGSGEPVVKLSTQNGPVDVRPDHELM